MPTKTCAVKVKATAADDPTLAEGQFTAFASVFHNVDSVGDVVMPGAFTDDLKSWEASGDPIPVYWGHQMNDPNMNIGSVLKAEETDTGLQVTAQLDLENPTAKQVYRLLKGRRVGKMSFAYDVEDGAPAERDGRPVYELRKLKLHEVSVVQVPANPEAVVQQVKEVTRTPVGGTNTTTGSATVDVITEVVAETACGCKENHTALRAALDQICEGLAGVKSALDSLDTDSSTEGKANPAQSATAEGLEVKADEPANRPGSASLRLRTDLAVEAAEVISLSD